MKKFILSMLLIMGINSFSMYSNLISSEEIIINSGWCSGRGGFLQKAENGGIMRIHEKCVIDGEDFYGVITTYHGFDRLRLSKPVSDSKRIYFEPGSRAIMNVYYTSDGYYVAFQYFGNVDIR